jgi:hypothetical protein
MSERQDQFWRPHAEHVGGKVGGALPRIPARGTPPETPSPLSLLFHVPERSSPSRVRCAAHKPRALDGSGPFRRLTYEKGKRANANLLNLRLGPASRWSAPSCTTSLE